MKILANGNSVNSMNSTRGGHLTDGEFLLASRRVRGRLWRRAGVEKAATWLLLAFEPCYKVFTVAVFLRSSPLFFSTPSLLLR